NRIAPAVGLSSPAMRRSSVVLPEPDGPSSAISSPDLMSSETSRRAAKRSNSLRTLCSETSIVASMLGRCGDLVAIAVFENGFEQERHQRERRKQRRHGEGRDEIILVVEDFDLQRHGVGEPAD